MRYGVLYANDTSNDWVIIIPNDAVRGQRRDHESI